MAECTIGEYPSAPPAGMQLVKGSTCLARQVLGVSGIPSVSQPFGGGTRSVRIWTDTKMAFRFGPANQAAPTPTVLDEGMSAGATEYFSVEPGDFFAVIGI